MRKLFTKVIFWSLLGILTVAWPACAELSPNTTPEISVGEKMGPTVEARSGMLVVRPEPATLMVLTASGLMAMSSRVMRKCRVRVR